MQLQTQAPEQYLGASEVMDHAHPEVRVAPHHAVVAALCDGGLPSDL